MPRWLAAPLSMLFWASCVLLVILWTPLIAFYRLATYRSDPDRHTPRPAAPVHLPAGDAEFRRISSELREVPA